LEPQEAVGGDTQAGVMVKAAPAASEEGNPSLQRGSKMPHSFLRVALTARDQKNANVRISMLSRGAASAGVVGSSKAECSEKRARPTYTES
jgi:hypothetical protein